MVIAPVFGFDDYQDYYRKTQSGQFLKGVRVPLLAVQVTRRGFPRHVERDWQRGGFVPCASFIIGNGVLVFGANVDPESGGSGYAYTDTVVFVQLSRSVRLSFLRYVRTDTVLFVQVVYSVPRVALRACLHACNR